jgi:hypothetical protein
MREELVAVVAEASMEAEEVAVLQGQEVLEAMERQPLQVEAAAAVAGLLLVQLGLMGLGLLVVTAVTALAVELLILVERQVLVAVAVAAGIVLVVVELLEVIGHKHHLVNFLLWLFNPMAHYGLGEIIIFMDN